MLSIVFSVILSFFLVYILKLVNFLICESSLLSREELTSFECGFDTHSLSRVPFSLRYYFLTLLFLLFDLEIVLLVSFPLVGFSFSPFLSLLFLTFFIFVLLFSLFYEWVDGTLEWVV